MDTVTLTLSPAIVLPAMLLVCPSCAAHYEIQPELIGKMGRPVRCAACRSEWNASPQSLPEALPASAGPSALTTDEAASVAADPATIIEIAAERPPVVDIETAALQAGPASQGPRKTAGRRALPLLPAMVAAQLVIVGGIVVLRGTVVRAMPQTAALFRAAGLPVNLRGLTFSGLRSSEQIHDGLTILIIEGAIENVTDVAVSVPRLRFSLRDAGETELVSWTAPADRNTLGPGETLPFRSRIAAPPVAGSDVAVRFLNRQDLTGAR